MATQEMRIRGEEVQIRLTRNGVLERTLTAIRTMTFTAKFAILDRNYLGESTPRKDDIFQGVGIGLEFDQESPDAWSLIDFVRTRATRRGNVNNLKINMSFTAIFLDGSKPRITTPDLKFNPMSINVGGREEYVGQSIAAECEDFKYSPQ